MDLFMAIQGRRTVRKFEQRPVEKDKIMLLLEAARLASSGGNLQPLRYLVIQNPELVKKLLAVTQWAAQVKPHRDPIPGKTAPLMFIAVTKKAGSNPQVEAGAAIENLQLAAYGLGLGCCWIGAYDHRQADGILELKDMETIYLVAVGYPAEVPVLENVGRAGSIKYYLDDHDVLHMPKYRIEAITEWR